MMKFNINKSPSGVTNIQLSSLSHYSIVITILKCRIIMHNHGVERKVVFINIYAD